MQRSVSKSKNFKLDPRELIQRPEYRSNARPRGCFQDFLRASKSRHIKRGEQCVAVVYTRVNKGMYEHP